MSHFNRLLTQCEQSPVPVQHGAGARTRHVQRTSLREQHREFSLQALLGHTGGASHFNPQRFNRYGSKDVCDRVYRHRARPMPELNSTQTEHICSLEQQRFGHK